MLAVNTVCACPEAIVRCLAPCQLWLKPGVALSPCGRICEAGTLACKGLQGSQAILFMVVHEQQQTT